MKRLIFAGLLTIFAAPAFGQVNNQSDSKQPGWVLPGFSQDQGATPATYLTAGWDLKTVSMGALFAFQKNAVVAVCEPGRDPKAGDAWRCQSIDPKKQ